jgi:hypothetical protein
MCGRGALSFFAPGSRGAPGPEDAGALCLSPNMTPDTCRVAVSIKPDLRADPLLSYRLTAGAASVIRLPSAST